MNSSQTITDDEFAASAYDISQNSTVSCSSLIEEIHEYLFERNISLEQHDTEDDKKDQNDVLQMSMPFQGPNLPCAGQGQAKRFWYDDDMITLNECVSIRRNLDFQVLLPVETKCLHHILYENIKTDEQRTLGLEPEKFVICSKQNIMITKEFLEKLKDVISTNDFITDN